MQPRLLFWDVTEMPDTNAKARFRTKLFWYVLASLAIGVVLLWSLAAFVLVAVRWIDPPTTAVHVERRLQAWTHHSPYREVYNFVRFNQIWAELQHAVIAAEDAPFTSIMASIGARSDRCQRGLRRRTLARSVNNHAATGKKPILRNGPLTLVRKGAEPARAGGRIGPRQTANSGDIPQRG